MPTKDKNNKEKDLSLLKDLVSRLLTLMGCRASASVEEDKENASFLVSIDAKEDAGLIIGKRGSTLNFIQHLLGLMFWKRTGEWKRIIVDVADWREKEKERLVELANQAAERAKSTGIPQNLYNLTSSQRRIIHLALAGDKEVETCSLGEGRDRYLVVRRKNPEN